MPIFYIAITALFLLFFLYVLMAYLTFSFAFRRSRKQGRARDLRKNKSVVPYLGRIMDGVLAADARPYERVSIRSHDGLLLVGRVYDIEDPRATVILFHGYRSFPSFDFGCVLPHYIDECRFRVLMVDERAHEESEGKYITFGIHERRDCLAWAEYAAARFGGPIILDGMSMGATSVLMATSLPLPSNVTAVIADSGYSSPEEILHHVGKRLGFPVGLLMPGVYAFCRLCGRFDPREMTVAAALQKNTRPVLIIHGEADSFVPFAMGQKNAVGLPPEMFVTVPGAEHGLSYLVDEAKVTAAVDRLFAAALAHEVPSTGEDYIIP